MPHGFVDVTDALTSSQLNSTQLNSQQEKCTHSECSEGRQAGQALSPDLQLTHDTRALTGPETPRTRPYSHSGMRAATNR